MSLTNVSHARKSLQSAGRDGVRWSAAFVSPVSRNNALRDDPKSTGASAPLANDKFDEEATAQGIAGQRRRRRTIGDIGIDLRRVVRQQPSQLTVRAGSVLLVVPLRGSAEVVAEDFDASLDTRTAALLVRRGPITIVWREGALGAVLHLPRGRLQAMASALLAQPVRFAGSNLLLERVGASGLDPLLEQLLGSGVTAGTEGGGVTGASRSFCDDLLRILRDQALITGAFAPSRSVKRAIDHIAMNPTGALDAGAVSAVAGVTPRTLRENFKASLGMAIDDYVQQVRLGAIRDRLASACESRAIAELARATGFGSATAFTRAYRRRFGETPTQTRTQAVHAARHGIEDKQGPVNAKGAF